MDFEEFREKLVEDLHEALPELAAIASISTESAAVYSAMNCVRMWMMNRKSVSDIIQKDLSSQIIFRQYRDLDMMHITSESQTIRMLLRSGGFYPANMNSDIFNGGVKYQIMRRRCFCFFVNPIISL